ncbi:OmpA family protein [Peristeroidobacter soli]|uniref:OmpA family protein n=1 Tax=Peristeroidobacter soli TaxID=2497877 RepID=UPI00101C50FC|nr:OmpA family protein [Peristeroidobacter soli]
MNAENAGRNYSRRARSYVAASVAVVIAAIVLWALYWPDSDCDQPSCARQRYSVALEVDSLAHIEPISFDVDEADEPISLAGILRDGGIELNLALDETHLPYDPASGPLDRADLFQFVNAWKNKSVPGTDATLYALFVNALMADDGSELFGIMFDTSGREGFAVAPRTTERFFRAHEPTQIATLQLRTFAHELLHAFNRHHTDAAQTREGRLTLEAPTRCISEMQPRGWRLREAPLMTISPSTIRFFQTAGARDILPGPANSPYTSRRASPTECDDVRTQVVNPDERSRFALALRRLQLLFGFSSAEAAEAESPPPSADIRLQAQSAAYPLGYPVAIRLTVNNTGEQALPIVGRLNPRYGMFVIEYRQSGAAEWQTVQPLNWFEPTSDDNARLAPGAITEATIPIYFGDEGWSFDAAGDYEVRARLQVGPPHEDIVSEPITIAVTKLSTPDDLAALQVLLDADGRLAKDVGRLLYFGGRIGDRDDLEPLERATQTLGHTSVGGALRLTLLSQRLRRPIDPTTGIRPAPNFEDAMDLIEDTCTDSGVAAMTSEVLEQRSDIPGNLRARAATDAMAWDGITASGRTIATYSDPLLRRRGPSLHFCFNEAELRAPARTAITKLARQLRRERASRVVVVGHSDSVGTCRYNDTLALKRARSVQRALAASGMGRIPVEVVSIGERRPMSFSSANEAQQLNRRVEILVEGKADDTASAHIIPKCPTSR